MRQQNTSWPGRMRQAARWGPRRAAFGWREASRAEFVARLIAAVRLVLAGLAS